MPFVLDASVALAWAFEDESTPYTDWVQDALAHDLARVPAIWPMEVLNAMLVSERRGRIGMAVTVGFIAIVRGLPIEIEAPSLDRLASETIAVARQHTLPVYDASYLDLAMRESLPLATRDQRLRAASRAAGVRLFE